MDRQPRCPENATDADVRMRIHLNTENTAELQIRTCHDRRDYQSTKSGWFCDPIADRLPHFKTGVQKREASTKSPLLLTVVAGGERDHSSAELGVRGVCHPLEVCSRRLNNFQIGIL